MSNDIHDSKCFEFQADKKVSNKDLMTTFHFASLPQSRKQAYIGYKEAETSFVVDQKGREEFKIKDRGSSSIWEQSRDGSCWYRELSLSEKKQYLKATLYF